MKLLSFILTIFVFLSGHGIAWAQIYAVMLSHRVKNVSETEAKEVKLRCILPATSIYQELIDHQVHPEPVELQIDGEGQNVVAVTFDSIPAKHTRAVRALLWIRLKSARVRLTTKPDGVEPLLDIQRQGHLYDSPLLKLDKVRPIAEKVIKGRERDIDKARALYEYMAKYSRYNIDGKEVAADAVLAGKPASCSELAFTYVALCRSVGIPARVVSSYVNRGSKWASIDWVTHRWAEFFAEGVGWVPVDPTNKINNPKDNFFGRQDKKYLAVIDDGVPLIIGPDPAWMVFVVAEAQPPGMHFEGGRTAVWRTSLNRPSEATFFKQACEQLNDGDANTRIEALKEWKRKKEPLRLAFLLEAMFDASAEVRKAAVEGIADFKDPSTVIPLMKLMEDEDDEGVKAAILNMIEKRLADKDSNARVEVIGELAKARTDEALRLIKDLWDDPDDEVRKKLAHRLYKFGDKPEVHSAYRRLVNDQDDFIRVVAALRWARTGKKEALEELFTYLKSPVQWDRRRAMEELVKHTRDDFGFNPKLTVNNEKNVEARSKFEEWIEKKEDK